MQLRHLLKEKKHMLDLLLSSVLQVLLFAAVPLLWWLVTARRVNFFAWIGLKKPIFTRPLWKVGVLTAAVAVGYVAAMGGIMHFFLSNVESSTSQFRGLGVKALLSILIYAVVQTSLSEEIFFRGFLGKRLIGRFGFCIGNGVEALCFGLLHGIPFFMATGNIFVLLMVTLLPALIGFYQGYLNEVLSSGSIVPSWILHAVLNVLSALAASL
jgi:CAAX amino terminal protease family.